MKLTALLNTFSIRRGTIAVLAYALALTSISATRESHAVSKANSANSDAKVVSDNKVEVVRDIAAVPATPMTPAIAELPSVRQVMMQVTAYCPCTKCCGSKAQGITASGKDVSYNEGRVVAADRSVPFGTRLIIPGYHAGQAVEVIDRGGAIKGNKLDVYFPTHQEALEWGRQNVLVTIVE
jgi:3D (Asp-Asp-Asp) domain-containing protein